ncbi:YkyA family protein [Terribacillus saccharophilus]|uniref:YkyA family protein n=1 Tax=Terribacillus saccharophilus TaxID=361277 RepID=UPI002DC98904|nr:YkyA family protein [Terribacillus saccharophilus]
MRKLGLGILLMGSAVGLTACNNASPEEQVYNHLEETVSLESGYVEQQESLTDLEKKEQDLYNEILQLGTDELDQIKSKSQEAIDLIGQRKDALAKEKESLDEAKAEFEEVDSIIDELESDDAKQKAQTLYDTMEARYSAYDKLHEAYTKALDEDNTLYDMFQQDDITQDELTSQIEKINAGYEEIKTANEEFNSQTEAFNEQKQQFYEAAGLNVENE